MVIAASAERVMGRGEIRGDKQARGNGTLGSKSRFQLEGNMIPGGMSAVTFGHKSAGDRTTGKIQII
jgi:hypothetical protein